MDFENSYLRTSHPPQSPPHAGPSQTSRLKIQHQSSHSTLGLATEYYDVGFHTLPEEIDAIEVERLLGEESDGLVDEDIRVTAPTADVGLHIDELSLEAIAKSQNPQAEALIKQAFIGAFLLDVCDTPSSIVPAPSLRVVEDRQVDKLVKSIEEQGDFRGDHPILLVMPRDELDLNAGVAQSHSPTLAFKPLRKDTKITCVAGNHRLHAWRLMYSNVLRWIEELKIKLETSPDDAEVREEHGEALKQLSIQRWWPVKVYDSGTLNLSHLTILLNALF